MSRTKKILLSTRIRNLLYEFINNGVLIEDLETFVDLCREYNCILKNDEFGQLIDDVEMYLMMNYTDDSCLVFLEQFNVIPRALYYVTI